MTALWMQCWWRMTLNSKMRNEQPTQNKEEWCLWRAQAACKTGGEVIDGATDPPESATRIEYALFLLIGAVGEIAEYLNHKEEKTKDTK